MRAAMTNGSAPSSTMIDVCVLDAERMQDIAHLLPDVFAVVEIDARVQLDVDAAAAALLEAHVQIGADIAAGAPASPRVVDIVLASAAAGIWPSPHARRPASPESRRSSAWSKPRPGRSTSRCPPRCAACRSCAPCPRRRRPQSQRESFPPSRSRRCDRASSPPKESWRWDSRSADPAPRTSEPSRASAQIPQPLPRCCPTPRNPARPPVRQRHR